MSWPVNPINGQQITINGILYQYDTSSSVWNRVSTVLASASIDTYTVSNLAVTQSAVLGDVSGVSISGGSSGYVLSTDGLGDLSWIAQGSTTPGGNDTEVQYNSSGTFAGSSSFTFNTGTSTLSATNISGSFTGNGSRLSTLTGANVTGTVPSSTIAGTVTTAAQPNITSVGTLTSLSITGNTTAGNLITTGIANVGSLSVTDHVVGPLIPSLNEVYDLGDATHRWRDLYLSGTTIKMGPSAAISATTSGNITIGTTSGTPSTTNLGNLVVGNYLQGTLITAAQPLITSVGNLSNLTVVGAMSGDSLTVTNGVSAATISATTGNITTGNITTLTASSVTISTLANITSTTAAISTTTGALKVAGGVGVQGNVHAAKFVGDGAGVTGVLTAGTVTTATQPNITSTGTLTGLSVSSGGLIASNPISFAQTWNNASVAFTGIKENITDTNSATASLLMDLQVGGTSKFSVSKTGNITVTGVSSLGPVGNVKITGGSSGQYLSTDGSGTLSWATVSSGGTPGGSDTFVQFNDGGSFGGTAGLTFNKTANLLTAVNTQFNGLATLTSSTEVVILKSGATGTVTHDFNTGVNFYHTSPADNFTANFTNVPTTSSNRSFIFTLAIVQGATPYMPTAVQVNGTPMTLSWLNGSAPSGNANKVDLVTFALIYTSSLGASTLLGQASTYG
jgi:hypothetical protein